jgi:hypothetical protein
MPPTITFEKPTVPTLWIDTSIGIKLAKIKKGEALQQLEVERLNRLRKLIEELVHAGRLLCPDSDQDEEYVAERLEKEVHGIFAVLSLGISLRHRQEILEHHAYKGMQAFIKNADTIDLPANSYFHTDPVAELEERRQEQFVITVGPFKSPEVLARRAASKAEVHNQWEELRQRCKKNGRTYEQQLDLELEGYWDGQLALMRKHHEHLTTGHFTHWDVLEAFTPMVYFRVWQEMGGDPKGWEGINRFFRSPYFRELPTNLVSSILAADLLTGNEAIQAGDQMDVGLLGNAMPIAHYVLCDKRMELRIKDRGLDTKCGTNVFSMSTIDGLFTELEKLR